MSRTFVDKDLLQWEAYPSGGKFGLPDRPKIIFNCLSLPDQPARYVHFTGDEADAEEAVGEMSDERLRELLATARELD